MTALVPPGARIALIAPAGQFAADRLAQGEEQLRAWGWSPSRGKHIFAVRQSCAGSIAERQADLEEAMRDPEVAAVWAIRGGFGCAHLLPDLRVEEWIPKPLIGFSDLTALLNPVHQAGWIRRGGQLIHGPVVQTLAAGPEQGSTQPVIVDTDSRGALQRLLAEGRPTDLSGFRAGGPELRVRGRVVGGNLSVLASLCGTPWQLRARGAIVLLEEVGEAPYRVDRLITQLIQSGVLQEAVGVAVGDLLGAEAQDGRGASYTGLELLVERLTPLGIPVVAGLPVGHGPRNFAWPVGSRAELSATGLTWL